MTKKLLFAFLLLSPLAFFAQKNETTTIKGNYLLAPGIKVADTKVMLQYFDFGKNPMIDSTTIDKEGNFTFNTKISTYSFYRLFFNANNTLIVLVPGEKLTLTIDPSKNYQIAQVKSASEENSQLLNFRTIEGFYKQKQDSILAIYRANNQAGNTKDNPELERTWDNFDSLRKSGIENLLITKPHLLANLTFTDNVDMDAQAATLEMVSKKLTDKFPTSILVKQFNDKLALNKATKVGSMAPDIIQKDSAGNEIKLSSLRGKWVIIDFWASWCRPCRAENPHMVQVYNKYNASGLEIFGVSLDKSAPNWKQAIVADGLRWTQVSDLKYWDAEPAKLYGVRSIPHTVILDPTGKIVAKNLRGEELDKFLTTIFKN